MAEAGTQYVTFPGDGLVARDVGQWVEQKVHYVDYYAQIFGNGMKNLWPRRAYVELFAGPGMSFDRHRQRFITGSPLRAMERNFTDYAFVDIDPLATDALLQRLNALALPGKAFHVFEGDCNDAPSAVRAAIPASALTLAFVDPTTWQVTFDSIAALTQARPVDLLFTFHAPTMRRMVTQNPPALTRFFGTDEWRRFVKGPRGDAIPGLLALYSRRLETIGYRPGSELHAVPIRNTRNVPIYYLALFSKNDRGLDFWQKTEETPWSGQLRLALL